MTTPPSSASSAQAAGRVRISCPGCGRHDWVSWPTAAATFHWKCFNCEKEFDLQRGGKH